MSARDTILLALTRYYHANRDPRGAASQALTSYDTARRAELLNQRSDVRQRMLSDAHAAGHAEALTTDGQAYDGELAMLRGLVRTLRVAVRPDEVDVDEVRRLLHEHASDEAEAYAREKSSRPAADATPDKAAARERRLTELLDTIRTHGGKWSSGSVQQIRRAAGGPVQRGTARRDLIELTRRGHLAQHGTGDGRYYTLRCQKGSA
ncbi:MAG: hypothetical protein HOV70_19865 [Streptomyces sp.]|nr:hypothetical protein [Streptomyces sp.]